MKQVAPAAERNRGPIERVLKGRLPEQGVLLEIASGTGIHAVHFAKVFPGMTIQPTDYNPEALASIQVWADEGPSNLLSPLRLDVCADAWPVEQADAVFCANMIHIAPWEASVGLFRGASRVLSSGKSMFTYGPYLRDGKPTTKSNADFDRSLRLRNSSWGIRDLAAIEAEAEKVGLSRTEIHEMPANNFLLRFVRQ